MNDLFEPQTTTSTPRRAPERRLAQNQLSPSSVQGNIEAATAQAKSVRDLVFLATLHARISHHRSLQQYTGETFSKEDSRKDLMRVTALLREYRKESKANLNFALELLERLETDSARREVVARMLTKVASNLNEWKKAARQRGLDFTYQTPRLADHARMLRTASAVELIGLTNPLKVQAFLEELLPIKT